MPGIAQGLQVLTCDRHVDQAALGDLKRDLPRRDTMQGQQPGHDFADSRHHHITGRQVDRDIQLRVGTQKLAKLLKQALQDKVGDLAYLPGVLRHGNEQVRTGQRAVRSTPAQQGLGADTLAAAQLKDRLIQHLQFAALERALQLTAH
ncbi:hypothetical protein D3C72_1995520 [compost metagenome]